MTKSFVVSSVFVAVLSVQACVSGPNGRGGPTEVQSSGVKAPEIARSALEGYLAVNAVPDSLVLLPAPPTAGSAALALDEEVSRQSLVLQGSLRGALATEDADLKFPGAAGTFSCALGAPITEEDTPHLYKLMERTLVDAVRSTNNAKEHYLRARPYLVNKMPLCAPTGSVGSYPSGHSATGWTWALIISEVAPDRTDAILARGRSFGQSRLICNAHWQSDVTEGRFMGAGTVARLHGDPTFRADLDAAKAEVAAARARSMRPTRDCKEEAAAMALQPAPLR